MANFLRALNCENRWRIVVPVLLLAAVLAGRQLNTWTFSNDETSTIIAAGARDFGPRSLGETLQDLNHRAPDQAFGLALVMNLWGSLVGWSALTLRALPWFAGLLTLALVYRVGRSLFAHEAGLAAALILASSVYFVSYMHVARAFTTVALFSTLVLWSYWRLALGPPPAARRHQLGLLLGGAGLLYAHYFAALILVAPGLIHLFLVRKNRRWWSVTLLLVLVGLSLLPELPVLLRGADIPLHRFSREGEAVMLAPEAAIRLLYTLTNSLVGLPQRLGPALLILALLALLLLLWRRPQVNRLHAGWFLAVSALAFPLLLLGINEVMLFLLVDQIRYFMAMWPALALLAGYGIYRLAHSNRRLADRVLAAVVASGIALILRSGLYLSIDYYSHSYLHLADQALVQQAGADDLLLLDEKALGFGPQASPLIHRYYGAILHKPRELITGEADVETIRQRARMHQRVWLLTTDANSVIEEELSAEMHLCQRPVRRKGMVLTLFGRSGIDCS